MKAGKVLRFVARYPYVLLAVAVAAAVALFCHRLRSTSEVAVGHTDAIGRTATQVSDIKLIGQWEALNISCEEMVDTFEEHFFGDKELVRIYTGKMRLGVDFGSEAADRLSVRGDTVVVRLPRVRLLNPDFIDEARTRTFYERGQWGAEANRALYEKARRAMLRRNLTAAQLGMAADNVRRRLRETLMAFGYADVEFVDDDGKNENKQI